MIEAYHVSGTAELRSIQPHLCDSRMRDDLLFGLPVAAFTTTRYYQSLPDRSPYPRSEKSGEFIGYRYTTTFDPDDFFKFKMAETQNSGTSQVHYLLLSRADHNETKLARFIRACAPELEDRDWNRNFPYGGPNEARWTSTYVNVFFAHEVDVTFTDRVKKIGPEFNGDQVDVLEWYGGMFEHAVQSERIQDVATLFAEVFPATEANRRSFIRACAPELEDRDLEEPADTSAWYAWMLELAVQSRRIDNLTPLIRAEFPEAADERVDANPAEDGVATDSAEEEVETGPAEDGVDGQNADDGVDAITTRLASLFN